jgi:hypothetical protein
MPHEELKPFLNKIFEELEDDETPQRADKLRAANAAIDRRLKDLNERLAKVKGERSETVDELRRIDEEYQAWREIDRIARRPISFAKPQSSQLHDLLEWLKAGAEHVKEPDYISSFDVICKNTHVFLIEHNWHAAFKNARDFDGGEIKYPYPMSCFELQIPGARLVIITDELSDTPKMCAAAFCKVRGVWVRGGVYDLQTF